jgi:gliding motility-associated protein GldE
LETGTILFSEFLSGVSFNPISVGVIVSIIVTIFLLITSALISGSEVAFFSLSPSDKQKITEGADKTLILKLVSEPERLLATILISNNFVNVGVIILSSYITNALIDFSSNTLLGFLFQVVIITFILLLFGEILPKVYAGRFPILFSNVMARPLFVMQKIFYPFSHVLIKSASFANRYFNPSDGNVSIRELSHALDITGEDINEDREILEGIVKFGNIDVKEVMTPRLDVMAIDVSMGYNKVKSVIIENGFSRMPVYDTTFDNVKGVLYIKDLLSFIKEGDDFNWQNLIRSPYFVPESKKINDLLQEFKLKKRHMALVVDEYGGASGIVTMEDILEEIVGDINDEDDEPDKYKILDENTYLLEAKMLLNDFCKLMDVDNSVFDNIHNDVETLAGLILELKGEMPAKHEKVTFDRFEFTIESVDNRRIKMMKVFKRDTK